MIIKNLKKYFTFEVRLKNDVAVMGRLSPKMWFNMMDRWVMAMFPMYSPCWLGP
jgi:translation initiation factor IF-1